MWLESWIILIEITKSKWGHKFNLLFKHKNKYLSVDRNGIAWLKKETKGKLSKE